jgi:hypothetical protein
MAVLFNPADLWRCLNEGALSIDYGRGFFADRR